MSLRDHPLCVVRACRCLGDAHEAECDGSATCGREASDGLLTCVPHRDDLAAAARALPGLHSDLQTCLAPYRSPQAPKPAGGQSVSSERDPGARAASTRVPVGLGWMRPNVADAGVREATGPIDWTVYELRSAVFEWLEVFASAVMAGREVTSPGRDVPSMARFVAWHADWLCTDPTQAPLAAAALIRLKAKCVNARARFRTVGLYLGPCPIKEPDKEPCGGPIRYDGQAARLDRTYQVECPWCGTRAIAAWWAEQMGTKIPALLPAVHLAMALSDTLALELAAAGKKITSGTIGFWKQSGDLTPVACDLKTRRDLFDRFDVEAIARTKYDLGDLPAAVAS
jgi:hypothetical protein